MLNASKHEARPKISSPKVYDLRRAVEDYDFDRLEVEAQQCVKLTSTNRPFGLIIKLSQTVSGVTQRCHGREQRNNVASLEEAATPKVHSAFDLERSL